VNLAMKPPRARRFGVFLIFPPRYRLSGSASYVAVLPSLGSGGASGRNFNLRLAADVIKNLPFGEVPFSIFLSL